MLQCVSDITWKSCFCTSNLKEFIIPCSFSIFLIHYGVIFFFKDDLVPIFISNFLYLGLVPSFFLVKIVLYMRCFKTSTTYIKFHILVRRILLVFDIFLLSFILLLRRKISIYFLARITMFTFIDKECLHLILETIIEWTFSTT